MNHNFSQAPQAMIPRSNFKRSHGYKTTLGDGGYLYPIYCDEALPGDTFNVKLTSIARLTTPIVPFMDNLFMDFFFFSVPNRLLWDNWKRFMGERDNPDDSIDYLVPQLSAPVGGFLPGSIEDYLGIPTGVYPLSVNALNHRAYNLIWNEWFRCQALQDSVPVDKTDGPDTTNYELLKRCKRFDLFTSCLPWPQLGPSVEIGIGSKADVKYDRIAGESIQDYNYAGRGTGDWRHGYNSAGGAPGAYTDDIITGTEFNLYADLANADAATVNQLREAFQLQKLLERDARGGTRYTEKIWSHFKVSSPDARQQRPEYLGGGSSPVSVTPIAQTTPTGIVPDVTPQGNLAAYGVHAQSGVGFTKSFTEHCTIIGFVNIRADITYQKGLAKKHFRRTQYDYYWPALAHLGEVPVLNKEIYCDGTAQDEEAFGYNEIWYDYRYFPSMITGLMRSNHPQSLDYWHLSQDFQNRPGLTSEFIEDNPPLDRVVAVTSEDKFQFDGYFDITTTRPMPMYSIPGLIDHY